MGFQKSKRRFFQSLRRTPAQKLGLSFDRVGWLLSRDPTGLPELDKSKGVVADDAALIRRVMAAYSAAFAHYEMTASFWDQTIGPMNKDVHDALIGTDFDAAAAVLRNPASNSHFWGFDVIAKPTKKNVEPHE